jgi:hypothetical protein
MAGTPKVSAKSGLSFAGTDFPYPPQPNTPSDKAKIHRRDAEAQRNASFQALRLRGKIKSPPTPMRKLRSDALWHTFTPAQQKKIQQWLFDDHFSYVKTHALMKSELGLTCALSTIGPIYHHLAELRANDAFLTAHDAAGQVLDAGVDVEKLRSASDVLVATRLFRELKNKAGVREIVALARLTHHTESREIRHSHGNSILDRLKLSRLQTRAAARPPDEPEVN